MHKIGIFYSFTVAVIFYFLLINCDQLIPTGYPLYLTWLINYLCLRPSLNLYIYLSRLRT